MRPDPDQTDTTALPHLGRYQLLEKLGEGGMGQVYLAHDQRLDRRVAVKVLPEGSVNDPDAVARFQREAKALAQLSHPGIIQAYDSEQADGRHFLVMEFVEGQSLAALLKEKGRLAPAVAADYAHQAALALQHAHEKGLVHRDVKPSNLLLTAGGRVKVLDLGLARFLQDQVVDPARTREGAGMGTPDYAAPEQFRDAHAADARADIYALGGTLFHLLTGQVPFPGSSLSEKYEAHAHKAPPPVEELCPEVPGGLALVVQKMLAKRPADRFQSAAEVAEALTPHVAGSSASFRVIRDTSTWDGGRLTLKDWRTRRQRLLAWAVAGASLVVALAVMFGPRWLGGERGREDDRPIVENPGQNRPGDGSNGGSKEEKLPAGTRPETPPHDPNVLTVSKSKEGGGTYHSIDDALKQVKPGQTIRVLDDAAYQEILLINSPSRHAGITLEAARRATIETTTADTMILIDGVPGVTLRGFRLHANGTRLEAMSLAILVGVKGGCPGLLLDRLLLERSRGGFYFGVQILDQTDAARKEAPLVVRDCLLRRPAVGISVKGLAANYSTPRPVNGVVLRENSFEEASQAVVVSGVATHVHVVGNRIWRADRCGLQLEQLLPGASDILVANNTFFECRCAFQLWDTVARGERVQLRNNLCLASKMADMMFLDSGGDPANFKGPGDGKSVLRVWRIDHNHRQAKSPATSGFLAQAWIPPATEDLGPAPADSITRDPADLASFLRPTKDSPLAKSGAGQTDPALPSYVGALPPAGVEPWDWDRTWKASPPGVLLTVSKAMTGGSFRTLNDALKAKELKPWATIRVLDDAVYAERILLDDAQKYRGLCLEAPNHAVIELTGSPRGTLVLKDVPDVCVSGFRFREGKMAKERAPPVVLLGQTPGVVLENLDIRTTARVPGIFIQKKVGSPDEEPAIVRRCSIQSGNEGIFLAGPVQTAPGLGPIGGIAIRDNRVWGAERGISLQGGLSRVQLTGNLVWDCTEASLALENLREDSDRLVIANNTAFSSGSALRLWDFPPFPKRRAGQVEVCNNLLFGASGEDIGFFLSRGESQEAGDSTSLLRLWRFHHNWRDLSGQQSRMAVPLAAADRKLDEAESKKLSRKPDAPDFLCPGSSSPLATAGAGNRDLSLPPYVGAVPPSGVRPWDWDRAWRGRASRAASETEREKP